MGDRAGDVLVVGVGHRDRGDDAIGPLVADAVAARSAVETIVVEGDPTDLVLRWRAGQHVVIVDAAVTGAEPGTLHVVDGAAAVDTAPMHSSTHAIGLGDALELARVLGRLPASLTIVGIEAASFDERAPLSTPVARGFDAVVGLVVDIAAGLAESTGPWRTVGA